MPNIMLNLKVDRVDLVDEGANSEAYIKMYKRKESNTTMDFEEIIAKMKPEHAVIVNEALAKAKKEVPEGFLSAKESEDSKKEATKAKEDLVVAKAATTAAEDKLKALEDAKKETEPDEEEVMKSLDPSVQEIFKSLKAQKEAAENVVKSLNDQNISNEAIAKAKQLSYLPVEEAKLVTVMKGITPEVFEILKSANKVMQDSGIFTEIGKKKDEDATLDAWSKIEKKAEKMSKDEKITKQKAIAQIVKQEPELYREYLDGGVR